MKKIPTCKKCGKEGHYSINCFSAPRTPIKQKTIIYKPQALKRSSQPVSYRKRLVRQLDTIFSVYIRMVDAINGKARCVTCGEVAYWREMHCGHFISRQKVGTRWSRKNCHVQCPYCNVQLKGNLERYKTYLQLKYGMDIIDELIAQSKKSVNTMELPLIIEEYQKKVLTLTE